jgi:hypothetical protein
MARKDKLGTGKRFAALRRSGKSAALVAFIGRKKYGAKKFAKLSGSGRHRAAVRRSK